MQKLYEQYSVVKPDASWIKQTEKQLKAEMPTPQWPIYSLVMFLVLGLSLGFVVLESKDSPIKIIQKQEAQEQETPQQQAVKAVKQAKKQAKKIQENIQEKILSIKTQAFEQDEIDPLVKLRQDLEKAKATTEMLVEIEDDIQNGDFVIAREKLDKWLKNGKNIDVSISSFDEVKVEDSIEK